MLKTTASIIIALALTIIAAASVDASITCTRLENGVKVVVQEDHSTDLVAVDVWVRTGSVNETDKTNGVSHFIEHLLFKGTETRGPGQVDMEIETLGGTLDARTSRDWTHFFTTIAPMYLDKSLDVLSDIIIHPKFSSDEIEHERQVIIDEIARRDSSPLDALEDQVFRTAYTIHPYRLPIEGTRESVACITRDTITNHYSHFYVPEYTTVVLVGDINTSDGIAAVKKAFAGYKGKPAHLMPVIGEPERIQQVRREIKRNTRLAYVAVAFPAPAINDQPNVYTMDVLIAYLGGGYQSWMSTELRGARKLAIDVSTDFLAQRRPGLAILMASTEPANSTKVEQAIFDKLASLRTTRIGDFDLDRAKRSVLGSYAFDVETSSGIATNLGFYETMGDIQLAPNYVGNIRKVTADDVLSLAKKYLDPNKAVVVVMGP